MRDLYCKCGELVARVERGSLIKKGTTFTCSRCNIKKNTYDKFKDMEDGYKRDNFNSFNDILKERGYDFNDIFKGE